MKKRKIGFLAAVLAAGILMGCGQDVADNPLRNADVDKCVTLPDYRNLGVTAEQVTVDDAERDYYVMESYSKYATLENSGVTDRPVKDGDTVNIDYVGTMGGEAFDGGTASGAFLVIGSDSYIDGFEDGLLDVLPGETVDLNLSFPEDYGNTGLAGKEVVFQVTVNYIVELRDETVAVMGIEGVSTVEGLRQYIYDRVYASKSQEADNTLKTNIMLALIEQSTFGELPEAVLENNREYARSIVSSAEEYGMDAETYASTFFGMSAEEYVNGYAEHMTKQDVILQAIANHEDLNVDNKELEAALKDNAEQAGAGTVEEYLNGTSREDYRNYLMNEKVMNYLVEQIQK